MRLSFFCVLFVTLLLSAFLQPAGAQSTPKLKIKLPPGGATIGTSLSGLVKCISFPGGDTITLDCAYPGVTVKSFDPSTGKFTLDTSQAKPGSGIVYARLMRGGLTLQTATVKLVLSAPTAPKLTLTLGTSSLTANFSCTGTVSFDSIPGKGHLDLTSTDPDIVSITPLSIKDPKQINTITVDTTKVRKADNIAIIAIWYDVTGNPVATASANLSVSPAPAVSAVTLSSTTGTWFSTVNGVVQLTAPAPADTNVALACSDAGAVFKQSGEVLPVDDNNNYYITIPRGHDTSDPFTISPSKQEASTGLIVTATVSKDEGDLISGKAVEFSKVSTVTVAPAAIEKVSLPAGTPIYITAPSSMVSSETSKQGDAVVFTVAKDVVVFTDPTNPYSAVIVIPKGNPVICHVFKQKHSLSVIHGGELAIRIEQVEAADGTFIQVHAGADSPWTNQGSPQSNYHPVIEDILPAGSTYLVASPDPNKFGTDLSWTTPKGTHTQYDVYRSKRSGEETLFSTTPCQSFADIDPDPDTTYYYEVAPHGELNDQGMPIFSNEVKYQPITYLTAIPDTTKFGIDLSWTTRSDDQYSYNIYRSEFKGEESLYVSDFPGSSFTDLNVLPDHKYYYAVRPVRYREDLQFPVSIEAKAMPKPYGQSKLNEALLTIAPDKDRLGIDLFWAASGPNNYYDIYKSEASGREVLYDSDVSGSEFTDVDIVAGHRYFYMIAPHDEIGQLGQPPDYSNEVEFTVKNLTGSDKDTDSNSTNIGSYEQQETNADLANVVAGQSGEQLAVRPSPSGLISLAHVPIGAPPGGTQTMVYGRIDNTPVIGALLTAGATYGFATRAPQAKPGTVQPNDIDYLALVGAAASSTLNTLITGAPGTVPLGTTFSVQTSKDATVIVKNPLAGL